MSKFKYELPSTLLKLFMGDIDYNMYIETKDEFDPFDTRDETVNFSSEIN